MPTGRRILNAGRYNHRNLPSEQDRLKAPGATASSEASTIGSGHGFIPVPEKVATLLDVASLSSTLAATGALTARPSTGQHRARASAALRWRVFLLLRRSRPGAPVHGAEEGTSGSPMRRRLPPSPLHLPARVIIIALLACGVTIFPREARRTGSPPGISDGDAPVSPPLPIESSIRG